MPLPFIFIIMKENAFDGADDELGPNEPLVVDRDGLYITVAQMRFWLDSRRGRRLFTISSLGPRAPSPSNRVRSSRRSG